VESVLVAPPRCPSGQTLPYGVDVGLKSRVVHETHLGGHLRSYIRPDLLVDLLVDKDDLPLARGLGWRSTATCEQEEAACERRLEDSGGANHERLSVSLTP
jgi:hypothetical protein